MPTTSSPASRTACPRETRLTRTPAPRQKKIQTKKIPIGSSPRRRLPNVTHTRHDRAPSRHMRMCVLVGRSLEVRDEIRAVLGLLEAREDHLGARDVLLGVEEVVVEGILAPLDALVLVSGGVGEALGGAGDATEETAEVGALWSWITSWEGDGQSMATLFFTAVHVSCSHVFGRVLGFFRPVRLERGRNRGGMRPDRRVWVTRTARVPACDRRRPRPRGTARTWS